MQFTMFLYIIILFWNHSKKSALICPGYQHNRFNSIGNLAHIQDILEVKSLWLHRQRDQVSIVILNINTKEKDSKYFTRFSEKIVNNLIIKTYFYHLITNISVLKIPQRGVYATICI